MYEISMMNMLIVGGATCHQSANIYDLCTNLLFWVSCVSVIWTLALVQCVCIVVFWCCLVPPTPPMLRPSLVCAVCLCVLQVRAASTVTSWSNQTPTALPNVPPPLQVGSAPDQQVYWPPTHTFADVYRFLHADCFNNCKWQNCVFIDRINTWYPKFDVAAVVCLWYRPPP